MAAPFVERKLADPSLPNRWRTTFFSGGVMEFWTAPQIASIHKMLNPSSIAIVGATPRMQYGGRLAEVVCLWAGAEPTASLRQRWMIRRFPRRHLLAPPQPSKVRPADEPTQENGEC